MTFDEIRALVVSVDPSAGHYESAHRPGQSYTVWQEIQRAGLRADNVMPCKSWRFQIDRYTKREDDPVPGRMEAALDACPAVAYDYQAAYEPDSGYIHHIFDCEAAGA